MADFRILSPLHLHRLKAISNCHAAGIPGVDSVGLRRNSEEETGRVLSKGEKEVAAIVHFPFLHHPRHASLEASSVLQRRRVGPEQEDSQTSIANRAKHLKGTSARTLSLVPDGSSGRPDDPIDSQKVSSFPSSQKTVLRRRLVVRSIVIDRRPPIRLPDAFHLHVTDGLLSSKFWR